MEILKFRDFEGSAELDMVRQVCRGKILYIDDLVTYEADSPAQLQAEFEAAVLDYIETCQSIGKEPQKSFRGQFNVRVPPQLHRDAQRRADADGVSLNAVVCAALESHLSRPARSEIAQKPLNAEATGNAITIEVQSAISGRKEGTTASTIFAISDDAIFKLSGLKTANKWISMDVIDPTQTIEVGLENVH